MSLRCPLPSKPFQVVAVAAAVTIVTQGEVEAQGAVGSEVLTDDVTLLFRSIPTFVPLSIGHIYRISVCKLESWSEVSHVLCQSSSHGRLVPKTSPQKAEQDHMWPQRALWTTPVLKVSKGQMLDFFKVLNVVLEVFLDLILSKQFAIVI